VPSIGGCHFFIYQCPLEKKEKLEAYHSPAYTVNVYPAPFHPPRTGHNGSCVILSNRRLLHEVGGVSKGSHRVGRRVPGRDNFHRRGWARRIDQVNEVVQLAAGCSLLGLTVAMAVCKTMGGKERPRKLTRPLLDLVVRDRTGNYQSAACTGPIGNFYNGAIKKRGVTHVVDGSLRPCGSFPWTRSVKVIIMYGERVRDRRYENKGGLCGVMMVVVV
jgi:hypothetical protein